ncbi:hypothetical protein, partial [Gelidibacter japonicus]|uniref:hypothetical protein n=1 Tax=Gelidibacter japonicus TaxID=1962232 RepID=UPI003A8CBFF3
ETLADFFPAGSNSHNNHSFRLSWELLAIVSTSCLDVYFLKSLYNSIARSLDDRNTICTWLGMKQ